MRERTQARVLALKPDKFSSDEKREALSVLEETDTVGAALLAFANQFLEEVAVKMLLHGNITRLQAEAIEREVSHLLKPKRTCYPTQPIGENHFFVTSRLYFPLKRIQTLLR